MDKNLTKAMVVAGVMSGTSADGVDVALVRISPGAEVPRLKMLGHVGFKYPKEVRAALLRVMEGEATTAAEMSRLHWRLGEIYADCVEKASQQIGVRAGLVGMHGQTVYHQGLAARFLGGQVRATWQIGEAAVVAERLRVPVVSDFRPADLAAGGQGAPLVPMLDFCLFQSKTKNRVLLNLGGIANLTAIPAGAMLDGVMAFDTGPANMVIDGVMSARMGKSFDRDGRVGSRGKVISGVVDTCMQDGWFISVPPKSCGREQFGAGFLARFLEVCGAATDTDVVATATELTVRSVVDAYARFCWPHLGQRAPLARSTEVIVAGGGAKNRFLMGRLTEDFGQLGVAVRTMDEIGVQAKEAVAFALLGWLTWNQRVGNVRTATGATRDVVLGKVSLG